MSFSGEKSVGRAGVTAGMAVVLLLFIMSLCWAGPDPGASDSGDCGYLYSEIECLEHGVITGTSAIHCAHGCLAFGSTIRFRLLGEFEDEGGAYKITTTYEHCNPRIESGAAHAEVQFSAIISNAAGVIAENSGSRDISFSVQETGKYTCVFDLFVDRACAPARRKVSSVIDIIFPEIIGTNIVGVGGAPVQLEYTGHEEVEWTSSDTNLAHVSDGLVTGLRGGDVIITATDTNGCARRHPMDVLEVRLLPDFNRDRIINNDDVVAMEVGGPFRFWANNDNDDSADAKTGKDNDIPSTSAREARNGKIDGMRDLIDFFPVLIDARNALAKLDDPDAELVLSISEGPAGVVYTDLAGPTAGRYLTDPVYAQALLTNEVHIFSALAFGKLTLAPDFVQSLRSKTHVLLVEVAESNSAPLHVELRDGGGDVVCAYGMPLNVTGVEDMFRHVNLLDVLETNEHPEIAVASRTATPANWPDSGLLHKNLVWVHGFGVEQDKVRGWHSEMFKRLYWAGSRAKFTGVTWGSYIDSPLHLNYHKGVINAFLTSEHLADRLSFLSGEVTICAHSLGNMVVSSAIADHGFDPDKYFMFNAAVAMCAYDSEQTHIGSTNMADFMVHQEWINYPQRLWASEWHRFFTNTDHRSELTWNDRFESVLTNVNVWNFYSEGEDLVRNANGLSLAEMATLGLWGTMFWIDNKGEYAWVMQEIAKGRDGPSDVGSYNWLMPDQHAGWEFSDAYDKEPSETSVLTDEMLREEPFFEKFVPYEGKGEAARFTNYHGHILFAPDGDTNASAQAALRTTQYKLLAEAIPALTFGMGGNALDDLKDPQGSRNVHLQEFGEGWPSVRTDKTRFGDRWMHSDLKDIAYPYVWKIFGKVVSTGELK